MKPGTWLVFRSRWYVICDQAPLKVNLSIILWTEAWGLSVPYMLMPLGGLHSYKY